MSTQPTIQIDFRKAARKYEALGGGLYKRLDGTFWERPKVGRVRTIRKLKARTERAARLELGKKRAQQAEAQMGFAQDPYATRPRQLTVADLAEFYLESGCPKRDRKPREGKQLAEEQRRVARLVSFFGARPWDDITQDHWRAYGQARMKEVTGKFRTGTRKGTRAIDIELATWSGIFRWARRNPGRTGVTADPLGGDRPRFHDSAEVRHCREVQPASGDELHQLAAALFADPRSEVLGWQLLFEAFIGQRTSEILRLRWDARTRDEPGFVEFEKRKGKEVARRLHLYRSKTHKGTFGYIDIHPALRQALEVLFEWHERRSPNSPWFFPSPVDPSKPVDSCSLGKALARICPALNLSHRTSHGLRSYFVNVLRSDRDAEGNPKISDAEIALRIGHKTGGKLIVEVYGEIGDRLSWMPTHVPPAWEKFTTGRPVQLDLGL